MALTQKEAILSFFSFDVPEGLVDKVIIDRSISPDANYTTGDTEKVELAAADIAGGLVTLASEKEGDFSITYDPAQMARLQTQLLRKHGELDSSVGSISARSIW
jgi:hypothetical protein